MRPITAAVVLPAAVRVTVDDVVLAISMLTGVLATADPDQRPPVARRAQDILAAAFRSAPDAQ